MLYYVVDRSPHGMPKKRYDDFLNSHDFFDVEIKSYGYTEIYIVAYVDETLVGARKILGDFNIIVEESPFRDRFKHLIQPKIPSWYFQALAVSPEYRNQDIGKTLLEFGVQQIPKEDIIFTSLMDTNVLKHFYSDYGFVNVGERDNRILLMRPAL